MPLITRLPFQRWRMRSMFLQFRVAAGGVTDGGVGQQGAPRVANEFSKCGMPWLIRVRSMVPTIQRGRVMPS